MLTRWQGAGATIAVVLTAIGMVAGDVADPGFRLWWLGHALTTDTVAGLLVMLITVLIVDQVVGIRQVAARSRAVAAQAAIVTSQAVRSAQAVLDALTGRGDREAADETRSYMLMLLVAAPVLIDAPGSRAFLEEAQRLGGELARALTVRSASQQGQQDQPGQDHEAGRVNQALERVRSASAPLLASLNLDELTAAGGQEAAGRTAAARDVR